MSDRPIRLVLSKLTKVKDLARGYSARCPAHEDARNSLSVTEGDDCRVLLHCFAGCPPRDVVEAIGLTFKDLFPT